MRFCMFVCWIGCLAGMASCAAPRGSTARSGDALGAYGRQRRIKGRHDGCREILAPRIFIVSLFAPEAEVWYDIPEFDLLAINVTVPGLSPILPDVHCTSSGHICQVVTGEGEINAASTMSGLSTSDLFNLSQTYFLIAGIAGINPSCGTLGSVCLAKYAVQVGLEYEIDARELSPNYTSTYIPLGATAADEYPSVLYGTEVFELNAALRDRVFDIVSSTPLNDSFAAASYRQHYPSAPANQPPTIIRGDVSTSDVFFHGTLLADAFAAYTALLTNGSGAYCMTAQEDNGILEALLRAALFAAVDFSRIILLRTAANFDRPPPGESAAHQQLYVNQGGMAPALRNIYLVGRRIVADVVGGWESVYERGITAQNYVGDVFGSLQGPVAPDIGSQSAGTG